MMAMGTKDQSQEFSSRLQYRQPFSLSPRLPTTTITQSETSWSSMHRWLLQEGTISPVVLSPPPHIINEAKSLANKNFPPPKPGQRGPPANLSLQQIQLESANTGQTLPH